MRQRTLTMALMVALGVPGSVAVLAQRPGPVPKRNRPQPLIVSDQPIPPPVPPRQEPPPAPVDLVPASPEVAAPPAAVPTTPDDPMQDVDAFVEQNRKRAADSIQRLTKEAEELRARLRKVEMALQRWKSVASALEPAPAALPPAPLEPAPAELSPAPLERAPVERDASVPRAPGSVD
jgi:hypothetical protein